MQVKAKILAVQESGTKTWKLYAIHPEVGLRRFMKKSLGVSIEDQQERTMLKGEALIQMATRTRYVVCTVPLDLPD